MTINIGQTRPRDQPKKTASAWNKQINVKMSSDSSESSEEESPDPSPLKKQIKKKISKKVVQKKSPIKSVDDDPNKNYSGK